MVTLVKGLAKSSQTRRKIVKKLYVSHCALRWSMNTSRKLHPEEHRSFNRSPSFYNDFPHIPSVLLPPSSIVSRIRFSEALRLVSLSRLTSNDWLACRRRAFISISVIFILRCCCFPLGNLIVILVAVGVASNVLIGSVKLCCV